MQISPLTAPATSDSRTELTIRYADLQRLGRETLTKEGKKDQQLANMASALNLWMRTFSFNEQNFVGAELGIRFNEFLLRFSDACAERLAARTQKDRQEQIFIWKRLLEAQAYVHSLPPAFCDALQAGFAASGLSKAEVCRRAGLSAPTFNRWLDGTNKPASSMAVEVRAVEVALGLPNETLVSRLPIGRRLRYARGVKADKALNAYGKRLRKNRIDTPNYTLQPTQRILQQWHGVLAFKTDSSRETGDKSNTWRLKALSDTGQRVTWSMLFDGQVCVTGNAVWPCFARFLGYLKLSKPAGQGLPEEEVDTIAWLVVPDLVRQFSNWERRRAGNIRHRGLASFLQTVISFVRPQSGYIWNHADLALTMPEKFGFNDTPEQWRERCALSHTKLKSQLKALKGEGRLTRSRDSRKEAAAILDSSHPLKALLRLPLNLIQSAPPPAHKRDYFTWIRDVLMVKLLVSNPLRIGHFSIMTYRHDGTGNLYRATTGEWRMRFLASDFKNEKGAAHEDYDVIVEESVYPWIQRYICEARPYAIDSADCDYLFLPFVRGSRPLDEGVTWNSKDKEEKVPLLEKHGLQPSLNWNADAISRRFRYLSGYYLSGTNGFGAHIVRHIIATDHLKRHPGDYMRVAHLLHDKFETVRNEYSHLNVSDGLKILHNGVQLAMAELEAEPSSQS